MSRLWRGEAALPAAFWLWGVGGTTVGIACAVLLLIIAWPAGVVADVLFFILVFATGALTYGVVVSAGIWRSARNYPGPSVWGIASRAALVTVWSLIGALTLLVAREFYQPPSGAISSRLASEARDRNASTVALAALTDFSWRELLVFESYVSRDAICLRLKISGLRCWWISPSYVKEGDYFFVFVDGDQIVHYEHHSHWRNGYIEELVHPVTVYGKGTTIEPFDGGLRFRGKP